MSEDFMAVLFSVALLGFAGCAFFSVIMLALKTIQTIYKKLN
jgi:hypothetical protein